jgi:hypothetical protein
VTIDRARAAEAVATATAGAVLGRIVGGLLGTPFGWIGAAVGGANGAICGWRRVYSWRRRDGWLAFGLDSTWALVPTATSMMAHAVAAADEAGDFEPSLTTRQNRHVYRGGAHLKRNYAFTTGNVISSAGDVDRPRRRRLITDHEDVHVWQARWFGPIYPAVYALWAAGGVVVGSVKWLRAGRRQPVGTLIESCSYYANPFEWWAYSRDDHWPPSGKAEGVGWKSAIVRPLADVRAERARH